MSRKTHHRFFISKPAPWFWLLLVLVIFHPGILRAADVTYTAQWSDNLSDWFPTGLTDLPTGIETTDTVERVINVSQGSAPKKFLRIHLSIPTP